MQINQDMVTIIAKECKSNFNYLLTKVKETNNTPYIRTYHWPINEKQNKQSLRKWRM